MRATVAERAAARLSMGFCWGRGFSSMGGSQWLSDHLYQLIEDMREYEVEPTWAMARKSLWAIAGRAGVSEGFLKQQLIVQKQQTEVQALRADIKDFKEKHAVDRHALLLRMLIAKDGNDIRGLLQFFLEEFRLRNEFVENDWNRNWDLILEKEEKLRLKLQAECKWPRAELVSNLLEMYNSLAQHVRSSELEASVELGRKGGYLVVSQWPLSCDPLSWERSRAVECIGEALYYDIRVKTSGEPLQVAQKFAEKMRDESFC